MSHNILDELSIELIIGRFRGPQIGLIIIPFVWRLEFTHHSKGYYIAIKFGPVYLWIQYWHTPVRKDSRI